MEVSMDAKEVRKSKRRGSERRLDERRLLSVTFASPKWNRNIKRHYLLWPRVDRRALDRRAVERRCTARRIALGSSTSKPHFVQPVRSRDILNRDEKAMLTGLFQAPGVASSDS